MINFPYHAESFRLPRGGHNFLRTTKTDSLSSESELGSGSSAAIESHLSAVRYFLTKSTATGLSRIIRKPVGLRTRSISIRRSSALQPFFSRSEKTVQAWRRSYVRG